MPGKQVKSNHLFGAGKGNRTPDSTLGRSRLTTKLYPRVMTFFRTPQRRTVVYGLGAGLASMWLILAALPATAATTPAVTLPAAIIQDGQTFKLDDGAKAGIFAGAVTVDASVTWTINEGTTPTLPANKKVLGQVYRFTIAGPTEFTPGLVRPAAVVIPFGSSHWNRQIWQYDTVTKTWTSLRTKINVAKTFASAGVNKTDVLVAMVENLERQEGIASWYCKRACSSRYPLLHGTSNDYAVGAMVRVTSHETGKHVDVKIISTWGQPAGRVVDLSWAAYSALATSNKGVTAVTVTPVPTKKVLGVTTSSPAPKIETIPQLTATENGRRGFPSLAARGFYVMDQGSGKVLAEHKSDIPQPIASLTKLMTAVVFLDTKPNLKASFTYAAGDETGFGYDYLRVVPGDRMLVRDLFYGTLVGSANNAATALIRAAGVTREEFVARMNAKAREWGMMNTTFVEASGLSAGNISTPRDVATMAAHAFNEYEPIRFVTVKGRFSFTSSITGLHSFATTDKMIGSSLLSSALTITGGKTGYIDESQYTYVVRTRNPQGAQVITVLLGSASSGQRFRDAAAIANWANSNFDWS